MKNTMLILTAAVIILSGCQDEKPADSSETEIPQIEDTQLSEVTDAMLVPEEQVVEEQGISTETFVDNDHDENNVFDWSGTYHGTLPCADCAGIDMTITLNQDGTYELTQSYLDKEGIQRTSKGPFSWNESKDTVTLNNEDVPNQYFVGEDVLMKLDLNGEIVTGELSSSYNLFKQQ